MPNLGIHVVYSSAELDFVTFMRTLRFANQEGVLVSRSSGVWMFISQLWLGWVDLWQLESPHDSQPCINESPGIHINPHIPWCTHSVGVHFCAWTVLYGLISNFFSWERKVLGWSSLFAGLSCWLLSGYGAASLPVCARHACSWSWTESSFERRQFECKFMEFLKSSVSLYLAASTIKCLRIQSRES